MNAPETDIDAYISQEGVTIEAVRAFKPQTHSTSYDVAQQWGENFNRGIYSLANSPTALANAAMSAAGFDYRFKRPLEVAAPKLDQEAMDVPEAQTAAGRLAGTIGEYAGANALPAAGMIAAAPRLAAMTAGATGVAGQSANRLAAGIAANPGTAATGELISTVGAGTAAQIARDTAPDSPSAELIAATIGGVAAPAAMAISPANLARKGVDAVAKRVSPAELEKAQRRQISDGIRQNLTPEGETAVREAADLQQNIPGYRPSIAEATESPQFIATQREFEAGLSGPQLDAANQRYRLNNRAVGDAIVDQAPQSTMSPDDIFAQARNRPARVRGLLDNRISQLDDTAIRQAESIAPTSSRSEIGSSLRNQIGNQKATTQNRMSQLASRFGLNDNSKVLPFTPTTKDRLRAAVQPRSDFADKTNIPSKIIRDIDAMDDQVSVVDLMALRSRITDDIRANADRPDGGRKIEYLEALKNELDEVADDIIRGSGNHQLAADMEGFRGLYRDELIQPFEKGKVGRVLRRDLAGSYQIPDEQVGREFFIGFNQSSAKQFKQVFPDPAQASSVMEAAALDDLFSRTVLDGQIDPNRLASWIRRNAGALDEFPQIKNRVSNLQSTVGSIANRRAVLVGRRKAIEDAYLSRELSRLDNVTGNTTPELIIDQAVKNPTRMKRLLNSVKTTETRDAIARHVWENALNAPEPTAYLKRNGLSVTQALNADQYKAASRLARAIEKNRLVKPPAGRALDTNPMAAVENVLGTGLNQMSSRVFAVKSGRTSSRYALADIAGRAFRTMTANQARSTLQAAIYDPQVAIDLANALETGALSQPSAKRIYTFLLSNGIVAANNGEHQHDQ